MIEARLWSRSHSVVFGHEFYCCRRGTKKKAPRVLHHAEPETERRIGAGGWGPPLVYCLKQDRGELVPVE
jgi:hypothetical protein